MRKVKEYRKTCYACPAQWEGQLEDGTYFYARYRYGTFRIGIGGTPGSAIYNATHGGGYIQVGDSMDGVMGDEQMKLLALAYNLNFDCATVLPELQMDEVPASNPKD